MAGILNRTVKPHMLQSLLNFVSFIRMSLFHSLSLTSLTYCGVILISSQRSAVTSPLLLISAIPRRDFLRVKDAVRYRV